MEPMGNDCLEMFDLESMGAFLDCLFVGGLGFWSLFLPNA